MTLNDLMKRVDLEKDKNKMFIFSDGMGWDNVNFEIKDNDITITLDKTRLFSDEN